MKKVELEIEHRFNNTFVGRHRLKPEKPLVILGSSRQAEIRLLGDDISGVHAALEYRNHQWILMDLASDHGTWIAKHAIVEYEIKRAATVRIGGHQLKIMPRRIDSDLFLMETNKQDRQKPEPNVETEKRTFHQVVVRRHNLVVESHLLSPREGFSYKHGEQTHLLEAPKDEQWVTHNFGDVLVQQRLIDSKTLEESKLEKVKGLWDPNFKGPSAIAATLMGFLAAILLFAPDKPNKELEKPEMEQNQYTRMIYDADAARQKQKKSRQMAREVQNASRQNKANGGEASPKAAAKQPESEAGVKVVNNIKKSGLDKLVGKISKRAAETNVAVQARGRSPDSASTGKALNVAGSTTNSGVVKADKNDKLGNVETSGKGGGSKDYKDAGGLRAGNVGSASVGVLQEETQVKGGLERSAIANVIQSQLGQVRYCYERQLSANPDLYGKVKVRFTIGGKGSVVKQKIGSSSLSNDMVEGCILRRVASWKFPKPKGGTSVVVTYPFLFKSTQ